MPKQYWHPVGDFEWFDLSVLNKNLRIFIIANGLILNINLWFVFQYMCPWMWSILISHLKIYNWLNKNLGLKLDCYCVLVRMPHHKVLRFENV